MSRAEPTRTVARLYEMDKRYKTRKGEGKREDRLTHLGRKRKAQTRSQASDTDPRPKVSIEATSVHGAYLTQDRRGQDAGQAAVRGSLYTVQNNRESICRIQKSGWHGNKGGGWNAAGLHRTGTSWAQSGSSWVWQGPEGCWACSIDGAVAPGVAQWMPIDGWHQWHLQPVQ